MSSDTRDRVDCFSVFSAVDPSALPRILEVFSLLGVVPDRCHCACLDAEGGQLVVDIQVSGLPCERAEQVERRLGRVVTVTQVLRSEKRAAA